LPATLWTIVKFRPSVPPKCLIVNIGNGKALDWNIKQVAEQVSDKHPRVFFSNPIRLAMNHHWTVEKQPLKKTYMFKTIDGQLALDGNIGAPQISSKHATPFLWEPEADHPNHRWIFHKISPKVYAIVNEESRLALNSSTTSQLGSTDQQSPSLLEVVLTDPNYHWSIYKVDEYPEDEIKEETLGDSADLPTYQEKLNDNTTPDYQEYGHHRHHHDEHDNAEHEHLQTDISEIHGIKAHKNYMIINVLTQRALDWNYNAAKQISADHERIFTWEPSEQASHHAWRIEKLDIHTFMIKTGDEQLALDGNTQVPQYSDQHPAPFLWEPDYNAHHHHWRFQKVGEHVYTIINELTGLALDGNNISEQLDPEHPSPFLHTAIANAPNQQWKLVKVPQQFSIVNIGTGKALDYSTAPQISADHIRVFQSIPASNQYHKWIILKQGGGTFKLSTADKRYVLDGNTNVPQHSTEHPAPFLNVALEDNKSQIWKFQKVEYHRHMIINEENGLALDGVIENVTHFNTEFPSPHLLQVSRESTTQHWNIQKIDV
jgi:hypothetical protein